MSSQLELRILDPKHQRIDNWYIPTIYKWSKVLLQDNMFYYCGALCNLVL